MSRYWDPAWEKPTAVMTVLRPGRELLEAMADSARPEDLEGVPATPEPCWDGERSLMANFGPDTTLLVPAPKRVATAELQKRIGSLNYYFICTRPRTLARDCRLTESELTLTFEVFLDDGTIEVLERSVPRPSNLVAVETRDDGVPLEYRLPDEVVRHDAALASPIPLPLRAPKLAAEDRADMPRVLRHSHDG